MSEGVESMGRGRAKAKQQKVARELKYNSQSTDLDALQRELGGSANGSSSHTPNGTFVDDSADDVGDAGDYEEDDRWTGAAR